MTSMRAAVLHGPRDVRIEKIHVPEPGPGQVRMRVDVALTGGTTLKVYRRGYHARMGTPPMRFGHEGTGVVDAVGEGVEHVQVGERVVAANSAPCEECEPCSRGLLAQCRDMCWMNGLFAEQVLVPARIVTTNLYTLPPDTRRRAAALSENLANVLKGHDRTPVRAEEHVVVLGTGTMGLLWTRLLSLKGATVTAVGRRPEREALARELGASNVFDIETFAERVAHRWVEVDVVVEAVGTEEAWAQAMAAVAPGGRVHLFGGPPKGSSLTIDAERLHYDEILLTSSFHHTPYHFAEALRLLSNDFVDPDLLVQDDIALDDLPGFLERVADGGGPLKVAVHPH